MTRDEAATSLTAAPDADACILRIEDADYGCEECRAVPLVWVQVLRRDGELQSMEVPESALAGLSVGSVCRLAELRRR